MVKSGITGMSGPGASRKEAGAPPRLCGVPWPSPLHLDLDGPLGQRSLRAESGSEPGVSTLCSLIRT